MERWVSVTSERFKREAEVPPRWVTLRSPILRLLTTDKLDFSCYHARMNGQEIIAKLRENEPALRARGVSHAALFGSRARGDNRPDSDTDIMIEIDPDAPVGVYEYVRIKEYIASLFDGRVDVVDREGLKPYVQPAATTDAIYAF